MQSIYAGQATYLDYKKRTKPAQTKDFIKKLSDPQSVTSTTLLRRCPTTTFLHDGSLSQTVVPMDHI
jgi:hypothetical protein